MKNKISKIVLLLLICMLCSACGGEKNNDDSGDAIVNATNTEAQDDNLKEDDEVTESDKSEEEGKDYKDENGKVYKTLNMDELWALMERYSELSEEEKFIQVEICVPHSSRFEELRNAARLNTCVNQTSASCKGNRQVLDISGLIFTEEHPDVTDEDITGALLPQSKYEALYEEFKAYGEHEKVILRGKIKACRVLNSYFYQGEDAKGYKVELAVTSAEVMK